jgi:Plasmid recombination enzyme.
MANYAIMRCAKIKTMGCVASALQHCYRERETPNADDARTAENEHRFAASADEAMGRLREQLPDKYRKDAVLAVEYVFTASPEWFRENPGLDGLLFDQSVAWLTEKYGADRIITATVHRDEATPHLSAFVVPLTQDGRLSAKEFIGGRDKMRADQTSYAEKVKALDLERGIEGSKAKHQSVQKFYTGLNKAVGSHITVRPENLEPQKTGLFSKEKPAQVAQRLTAEINDLLEATFNKASQAHSEARRREELEKTSKSLTKSLKETQERLRASEERVARAEALMKGLTKEQVSQVNRLTDRMRDENRERRNEQQRAHLRDRNKNSGWER